MSPSSTKIYNYFVNHYNSEFTFNGVYTAVYGKCHVDYLARKILNTYNEKNLGDTSHQALTKYIFSEILITYFRRN